MKLTETVLIGSILTQGCVDVSVATSSGIDACDDARRQIRQSNIPILIQLNDGCDSIRALQTTIASGIQACAASPTHHLAMMHLDRRLHEDRSDCFQNFK